MTMTATARPIDGTLRHQIDVNGRHTITTDQPERLGGSDTAPAPHELMPATIASCVSTMITVYARERDWQLDDLRGSSDFCFRVKCPDRLLSVSIAASSASPGISTRDRCIGCSPTELLCRGDDAYQRPAVRTIQRYVAGRRRSAEYPAGCVEPHAGEASGM